METPINFSNMAAPLLDAPIKASWIIEGAPRARNALLSRSDDYLASTILWDCTAGKFHWHYNIDETVHILQGAVTVDDCHGTIKTLKPGDTAFFPKGSHAIWHVESYVKKVAFCRVLLPEPMPTLLKIARFLKNKISPRKSGGGSLLGAG